MDLVQVGLFVKGNISYRKIKLHYLNPDRLFSPLNMTKLLQFKTIKGLFHGLTYLFKLFFQPSLI